MTDYKKLILGFGVKEGRAYTWDGRTGYSGPLADWQGRDATTGRTRC